MNDYEARQEARRERYEKKAEQLRAEASRLHDQAHEMASVIPLGQPILVGHYSEGRDRRYRERIHNAFGKAFATMDKAEHYEQKAASVGRGGISSDDPDAIQKLREKLEGMKRAQEYMKAVNAAIRKGKTPEKQVPLLMALGISEEEARAHITPDPYMHQIGYPPYALSNNNTNMHRIEERIRQLEAAAQRTTREEHGDDYTYREDVNENRVMFLFDGKPEPEVRALLKSHGFKWSPTRTAWVRMLNNSGRFAAERVRRELDKND